MKTISPTIMAFFIFSMLCLSFLSLHVSAFEDSVTETINLSPVADAYVNSYHSDENEGDSSFLYVKNSEWGTSKLIFIKFHLSDIPADASIKSAQLKLRAAVALDGGDVSAYYVPDDSWRELGLTYDNRPNISNTITYTEEGVTSGSLCSWDITEDVLEAFHDDKLLTEAVMWENTTEYGHIQFFSRESGWPPKLEITYTIPTSSTPTPLITPEATLPPISTSLKEKAFAILKNPALAGLGAVGTVILVIFGAIRLYFKRKTKV